MSVPHDVIAHDVINAANMNQAQQYQAQLEKDDLTFEEAMLLRMDNPTDTRYQVYSDLIQNCAYHKSFAFFADNSAMDIDESMAVKFWHVSHGDILEITHLYLFTAAGDRNQAQQYQIQLGKDCLSFEESMLVRRETNPGYQTYADLLRMYQYHKSFAFFADNSALDKEEGIAVKFTQVIDGDIIETTYLN